ncbi:MAG: T9SS type A sorting domain-containing protein [Bacteroidetes bacterium]|nr:T9SS type A sorting domain-containing protein [Bacteroidota bacterium]
MKKHFIALSLGLFFCNLLQAQYTKDYDLISPSNQSIIALKGNSSADYPLIWSSGKVSNAPSFVNYQYSLFFDSLGGNMSGSVDVITPLNYSSSFKDSSLHLTGAQWASFLNGISQKIYGHDFAIGDTLKLLWQVNLVAVSPGPAYEFKKSTSYFEIIFVRGQFDDEYVPVHLKLPLPSANLTISGDPNSTIDFSWTAAYCPGGGCDSATYDLMIDTIDGNFSTPYFSTTTNKHDSSSFVIYNVFSQLLKDCHIPFNGTKTIYWKVRAYGNTGSQYSVEESIETGSITLKRQLLDNENFPFSLINPSDQATVTLAGKASTQLNFKWNSSYTPKASSGTYFLVMDSLGASPLFYHPLQKWISSGNGADTAINLTYGMIDHALDSVYPNWFRVTLMWSVIAKLSGTDYYAVTPFEIEFIAGNITGAESIVSNDINIYPVPADRSMQVNLKQGNAMASVYDIRGQLILNKFLVPDDSVIDTYALPSGIYILHVESQEGILTRKFEVRH